MFNITKLGNTGQSDPLTKWLDSCLLAGHSAAFTERTKAPALALRAFFK